MDLFSSFTLAFIPLFVAMDAVGVLPIYVALIEGEEKKSVNRILLQAVTTAVVVGVLFLFVGKLVFSFLGITVGDFKVAGGLILLIFAINDLLFGNKNRRKPSEAIGVVPLGMPLIVGPAVLTALIMQVDMVGTWITLLAFGVNVIFSYLIFRSSDFIVKWIGKAGTQGVSKVANLFLAAIGVMIIRIGITELIGNLP